MSFIREPAREQKEQVKLIAAGVAFKAAASCCVAAAAVAPAAMGKPPQYTLHAENDGGNPGAPSCNGL
jgi:hypothetical protein